MDGESYDDVKKQLTEARDKMLEITRQHDSSPHEYNGGAIEVLVTSDSILLSLCVDILAS